MARLSLFSPVGLVVCCLGCAGAFSTSPIRHAGPSATSSRRSALPAQSEKYDGTSRRREFVIQSITAGIVSTNILTQFADPALADENQAAAAAAAASTSDDTTTTTIDPSIDFPEITQKVYLEVKFGNYKPKKLVIGLFGNVAPKAVENFSILCSNTSGPSYDGSSFYRALSGFSIQGGAIGNNSGKSGTSAFDGGKPFPPDNFKIRHTKAGLLSAVRGVNGEIDSRFFIQTESDAGWADDRYAAFGIVLEEDGSGGMDLVRRISKVDVKPPQNSPKDPVMIVGCGIDES